MRTRIIAFVVAVTAMLGFGLVIPTVAHADTFMNGPRSGSTAVNQVLARFQRECLFGSSGKIILRVKAQTQFNSAGTAVVRVAPRAIQIFNRYNADSVVKVISQRLEDDAGIFNADNVSYSLASGANGYPDWFDTNISIDFYAWNTGRSSNRYGSNKPAYVLTFEFPHLDGIVRTCALPLDAAHYVGT